MPGDPRHIAEILLSRMPDEVRKSIGADELNDRLVEASRLNAEAADPRLSLEDRRKNGTRAQQVMSAVPRAVTERLVAEKIAKAAQLGNSPHADMLRRQAQEILDQNPPAPRRAAAVRKAKADPEPDITPVFDEDGQLIGVVDTDKITPLSGKQSGGTAPPPPAQDPATAQAPAPAGQPVAKASRLPVVVLDGRGARYMVDRRDIRQSAVRKAGGAGQLTYQDRADGMTDVIDAAGRPIGTINSQGVLVRQGYVGEQQTLSPAAQARNTGPVQAGGTTGMGQPRMTGPAAALPGDGPQAKRPGDVEARAIIKSLGPQWRMMYDHAGRLCGAVQQCDIRPDRPGHVLKGSAAQSYSSVCNSAGRRVGIALTADTIPLSDLRTVGRVAKALRPGGR